MEEVRHALQAFVGNIPWLLPDMDTGTLQLSPARGERPARLAPT